MALPSNTLATYAAVGNREDLSDIIYRIDPTDTPFMTGAEKEKASAVKHEWQTQALATAVSNNAQLEGDDSNTNPTIATVRLANNCMISTKTARVSGTQQAVDHAGRDNELAYQEMLKGLELKRDMETQVLDNQNTNAGNATTARVSATILSWLKTNTVKGAGGSDPAAADGTGTRTDGTQRAFTEAQLKTVLASCWTNGGKPDIVMVGAFNKQQFSTFTGRASPIEDTRAKKITASVDAYESDFGKIKVVANRFMRTPGANSGREALILDLDKWAIAFLNGRKMLSLALAKTGDSDRRSILSEYCLVSRNEKASGIVADLTTS